MKKSNRKDEVFEIWQKYCTNAEWEKYDFVDPPYCWSASVYLEVDGYVFEGDGCIISGGEREINELTCTTPDGEVIKIY